MSGDSVNLSDLEADIAPEPSGDFDGEESDFEGDDLTLEIGDDVVSVGDIYANLITVIASELIENYGSGDGFADGNQLDTTLAKQLQIDQYANQVAGKHSIESMTPEQALMVSTFMFFGAIVISDPEIVGNLRDKVAQ